MPDDDEASAPDATADAPALDAPVHRAMAVAANNSVWELLDGRDLTVDEADDLLERAYAAAHHWRRAQGGTAVHRTRASWLLSRTHVVLGHGELGLHHADRCAAHLAEAGDAAEDFDRVYAVEARARALACVGRDVDARDLRDEALTLAASVADPQDREIVDGDLAAGPWFGLDA